MPARTNKITALCLLGYWFIGSFCFLTAFELGTPMPARTSTKAVWSSMLLIRTF